jgi:Na+/H+ antiporter NhaD/arsenite permease-like protein/CBS domain-containing protein
MIRFTSLVTIQWLLVTHTILLPCDAFTPNAMVTRVATSRSPTFVTNHDTIQTKLYSAGTSTSSSSGGIIVETMTMITPEGYGFSSPMGRVLTESNRKPGYHKAKASDTVIDVMQAITSSRDGYDVALVFDNDNDDKLLGLFTESDYIRFSTTRAKEATNIEQSATYLMACVNDFMTPVEKLVSLSIDDTANVAIAAMKDANVRHIIVADRVKSDRTLFVTKVNGVDNSNTDTDTVHNKIEDSAIKGVVSMQDIMGVIQRDERLSLTSLQQKYPEIKNPVDRFRLQMISDANALANNPQTAKEDIIRVGTAALFFAITAAFVTQVPFLQAHADWAMIGIFILGYAGIIFEEVFEFNKAGVALLMSTALWIVYADFYGGSNGIASGTVLEQLGEQLAEVSDICFFLLAASAIVEVVDSYEGFKVVTSKITTTSKKELFWTIGILTFVLSSILNNLTVTIVMISLLRKLIPNENDRRLFGAMVVVAANAGGVWTPIGDVTTTMLWINNQLSTIPTITDLFLPSAVCLLASLAFLVNQVNDDEPLEPNASMLEPLSTRGQLVFWSGIASLLAVPVFNDLTGLPPYLAMLTGLGLMWTLTDILHMSDKEKGIQVPAALSKLDIAGILFFLGILMSIGVLDKSGLLKELAVFLSDNLPSLDIIATAIGLFSALIDNVPLVAATM